MSERSSGDSDRGVDEKVALILDRRHAETLLSLLGIPTATDWPEKLQWHLWVALGRFFPGRVWDREPILPGKFEESAWLCLTEAELTALGELLGLKAVAEGDARLASSAFHHHLQQVREYRATRVCEYEQGFCTGCGQPGRIMERVEKVPVCWVCVGEEMTRHAWSKRQSERSAALRQAYECRRGWRK